MVELLKTSSYTELTSNITASQFKRKHQVVVLRYAVSGAIDAGQSETENRFRVACSSCRFEAASIRISA